MAPLNESSKLTITELTHANDEQCVVPSFNTAEEIDWTPVVGDLALIGNNLKVWTGAKWQGI